VKVIRRRPGSAGIMSDKLVICDKSDRAQAEAPFLSAYSRTS
jgi:hypothetical protein